MAFSASLSSGKLGSAPAATRLCHNLLQITYTASISLLLPKARS